MSGNGRNLVLLKSTPSLPEVVWVPVLDLPWRDDEQDRIQPTDLEKSA